jgi:hypothetical protein
MKETLERKREGVCFIPSECFKATTSGFSHQHPGLYTTTAYDFFRFKSVSVCWDKVVWKQWSLSRHNFGLWLAIIGKSSIFFGGVGDDTKLYYFKQVSQKEPFPLNTLVYR